MKQKYILTDETIEWEGRTLHRIQAAMDFGTVKKGERGGFIEEGRNLSYYGLCWIKDDAKVYENALVHDNAIIRNKSIVHGSANIFGHALIAENVNVYGFAQISGNAIISNNVKVYDHAYISGFSRVFGNAIICEDATVIDFANISENAKIFGKAVVKGFARIKRSARIQNAYEYITIGPIGSRGDFTTFYKSENNDILVVCGCFFGTLDRFARRVHEQHSDTMYAEQYYSAITFAKRYLKRET